MRTRQTGGRQGGAERFAPELTLGEARARLFALGNLGDDGGYGDAWVKVKLWRIPIVFPNTQGRRRAVKFHDLHHVLTEYPTTWRGEFEIAAWEIANGVGRYWEGWLLDLLGFACGLVVFPRSVYRAFLRGRRSKNLYFERWDEALLAVRVGEMRRRLRLDAADAEPEPGDRAAFALWSAVGVLTYLAVCAATVLPALALLGVLWLWLAC
ncbi:MAG: hypothetical protein QOJ76_1665 [Acidobacteriota bacterium]|jgi:hypothetical protein|nr:hypothetical protein [Acidobacteriota bacterium]